MYALSENVAGGFYWMTPSHQQNAAGFWSSVWGGIKKVVNLAKPAIDAGKKALANVPVWGTGLAAGIGALQGAAEGKDWKNIALDAVQSAVPGGAGGQAAFGAARGALTSALSGGGWRGALSGAVGGAAKGALSTTSIDPNLQAFLSGGAQQLAGAGLAQLGKKAPPRPATASAPPALSVAATQLANRLLQQPELRNLKPGELARAARVSPAVVPEALAAVAQAVRTGGGLSPGDQREVFGKSLNEVLILAASPRPSAPTPTVGPRRIPMFRPMRREGLMRLVSAVPAVGSLPIQQRQLLALGRSLDARGFDSDSHYWIVTSGEYPALITKKITGETKLTQKLVLANGPNGLPDGLKRTLEQTNYGYNFAYLKAGDRLRLPPEFEPFLPGGSSAPAPGPAPAPTGPSVPQIEPGPAPTSPPGTTVNIPGLGTIGVPTEIPWPPGVSPGGSETPPVTPKPKPGPEPTPKVPNPPPGFPTDPIDPSVPGAPGTEPAQAPPAAVALQGTALLAAWAQKYPGETQTKPPFGSQLGDIGPTISTRTRATLADFQVWWNDTQDGNLPTDGRLDDPTYQALQKAGAVSIEGAPAPGPVPSTVPTGGVPFEPLPPAQTPKKKKKSGAAALLLPLGLALVL